MGQHCKQDVLGSPGWKLNGPSPARMALHKRQWGRVGLPQRVFRVELPPCTERRARSFAC